MLKILAELEQEIDELLKRYDIPRTTYANLRPDLFYTRSDIKRDLIELFRKKIEELLQKYETEG